MKPLSEQPTYWVLERLMERGCLYWDGLGGNESFFKALTFPTRGEAMDYVVGSTNPTLKAYWPQEYYGDCSEWGRMHDREKQLAYETVVKENRSLKGGMRDLRDERDEARDIVRALNHRWPFILGKILDNLALAKAPADRVCHHPLGDGSRPRTKPCFKCRKLRAAERKAEGQPEHSPSCVFQGQWICMEDCPTRLRYLKQGIDLSKGGKGCAHSSRSRPSRSCTTCFPGGVGASTPDSGIPLAQVPSKEVPPPRDYIGPYYTFPSEPAAPNQTVLALVEEAAAAASKAWVENLGKGRQEAGQILAHASNVLDNLLKKCRAAKPDPTASCPNCAPLSDMMARGGP